MSDAYQTQATSFAGLQLIGKDSTSPLKNANMPDGAKTQFSNELKRANHEMNKQVDAANKPDQIDTDEENKSLRAVDKQGSKNVENETANRLARGALKDKVDLSGRILSGEESLPTSTADIPEIVNSNLLEPIVTEKRSVVENTNEPVVSDLDSSAGNAEPRPHGVERMALEAVQVTTRSVETLADEVSPQSTATLEFGMDAGDTSLAMSVDAETPSAAAGDELLTVTSVKSDISALQTTADMFRATVKADVQNQNEDSGFLVDAEKLPIQTDAQPQIVSQLPAAATLNANNRHGGLRPNSTAPTESVSEESALTVAESAPLLLSADARVRASVNNNNVSVSNITEQEDDNDVPEDAVQLVSNLVMSARARTGSAETTEQVLSPTAMAKQALSDEVQIESVENTIAASNLIQRANQPLAQALQSTETMNQSATNSASEAANNMFQVLPSGIITAPMIQRSELSPNLVTSAPYTVPLMNPDADEALAGNVRWMVADGIQNAVVNIAPSGMGPISVKIGIENEQMNVSIIATQGSTREALDALLPRLREQLGAQGLDTVRVDVSDGRSDGGRSAAGQQFGQGRGDLTGNGQNNNNDSTGSEQRGNDRSANETERQRVSDMQNAALDLSSGDLHSKSLYDAYV